MTCKRFLISRKDKYGKSDCQKILDEATNSDNWNVPNSKLQVLADHTYDWYVSALISIGMNTTSS